MNNHGIKKKNDYQHIRLRTNMYLGSVDPITHSMLLYDDTFKPYLKEETFVPALYTALRELIDNALDEVIGHGYGNKIEVNYDPKSFIFSVKDNGRGIPTDWDEINNTHLVTMVLTEPRAGRNFDAREEVVGTNGIGSSAVSNTSEWFEVEVERNNETFHQRFEEGDIDSDELTIHEPSILPFKSKLTGTKVSFKPSSVVYKNQILPEEFVRSRIVEIAIANPSLKVYYNGDLIKVKQKVEQNIFPNHKPIMLNMNEGKFNSNFWIIPNWQDSGEHTHTLVNNIFAFNGGVHIDTFKRLFYSNLLSALEKESKRRKLSPNRSDVNDGILIYNITNMHSPNFDSQSKSRLINEDVTKIIKSYLEDENFFKDLIRKNKEWIDNIYQRCSDRTMKKDASDLAKAAKKNLRTKVPKLMDANAKDRSKCQLFIMEGLSAASGVANVRDPEIHGTLPLKGKVMNVNGINPKKAIDNSELSDIMGSLGLIIGQKAVRENLRYGKLYIATDEDQDGKNIAALLINFFHTYWPELFEDEKNPFVYIFMTPFIIASHEKNKTRKYWYGKNYHEFVPSEYKKSNGWEITRAKGLSTMVEDDWRYSLDNPELYAVIDDGNMEETLDLIFNEKRADDRKDWIGL